MLILKTWKRMGEIYPCMYVFKSGLLFVDSSFSASGESSALGIKFHCVPKVNVCMYDCACSEEKQNQRAQCKRSVLYSKSRPSE